MTNMSAKRDLKIDCLKLSLLLWVIIQANSTANAQDTKTQNRKVRGGSSFSSVDSTNIDFSETMIDGKMQAPQGFFLQGKKSQTLTQMVRLRSKWRSELQNSKSAVKSLVK
jgi:hypothetical protein